jgi:hypothetical protein
MDMMSVCQAFEAMNWFVKQFQDQGPFEDTGALLHALYQASATNPNSESAAIWQEWRHCVNKTLSFSGPPNQFPLFELGRTGWDEQGLSSDRDLTILQAYEATQLFLYRQYLKTNDNDGGIFYLVSNMDLSARMDLGLQPYPWHTGRLSALPIHARWLLKAKRNQPEGMTHPQHPHAPSRGSPSA